MKKDLWKFLVCVVVGALLCHVKMMGCYPFVVVWFVAVYIEEFYTRAFFSFMALWMVLWLPIASLCRYGIALLVWVILLALARGFRMHMRRITQSLMAGLVLGAVSYGGMVLTSMEQQKIALLAFECMLVGGLSFLVNRPLAYMLQWEKVEKKELYVPERVQAYSDAMVYLAKNMEAMIKPEERTAESLVNMEHELKNRICVPCDNCKVCFGADGTMSLVFEELLQTVKAGDPIGQELEEKIYTQCDRAEILIRESLSVFEKMELNLFWYRRLCENREMIARQIDTMAKVMGEVIEEEKNCDRKERWRLLQIKYQLRDVGVRVRELHCFQNRNGAIRLEMELSSKRRGCVTIKEVLAQINHCVTGEMVSTRNNRTIVGREKATYVFVMKPKIQCTYGVAKMVQAGQKISGDSFRAGEIPGGRFAMVLSDGMGSGRQANVESRTVVDMFWQFMESGFAIDVALRLMNAAMIFGADKERFSTMDTCVVDVYSGIVDFYKVGAHVSFIKRENSVEIIDANSLPMGAAAGVDTEPERSYLQPGDILVMVTDGVLEYLHVDEPIQVLRDLISDLSSTDAAAFSRKIMERILLFTGGRVQDDMTVLTLKIASKET